MRWILSVLAGVLAVGFVSLAAVGGGLYWQRVETRSEQAARDELGPLAQQQIPTVFTYDYKTVERSLTDAYRLLTPDYRREFENRANADIIPQARARELVSQANVVGVGVMDAQRDSGAVMVYINRTVSEKTNRDQPIYDGARLRVEYKRIDGKWLINYITPI
ncbi:Macrophage killing protein with similarity to conjugation protein [Mycolicibacterium rhodesiae NBB3]|jgi:Mce-associated membrane protein|uniref:Macrophage killing protein with similarity to conjugation protein n=1 Tax=Mycolicibacterium rhodesiae (strain NBB3) TaxID=710685 RepID=G8RU91_MYCRN|nr:mammalian cell entry protein [Mycolicibacterium rhodesiae]AEV72934.1 Macrophage killing protein with similarity to conjugation protein [Mycolicibacterium rhodesiae NBB3]